MGTLQNVQDYFKDKKVPDVHPFQDVPRSNTYYEKNKRLDKEGQEPFGYQKDKVKNTCKDHKSLKVEK